MDDDRLMTHKHAMNKVKRALHGLESSTKTLDMSFESQRKESTPTTTFF